MTAERHPVEDRSECAECQNPDVGDSGMWCRTCEIGQSS